jgi:membrane-associated phospholipid phosphatase
VGSARVLRGVVLAGGAAVVGHAAIRTADGAAVDRELFAALNGGHGPGVDRVFHGITELGSIVAPATAAGVLAATGRRRAAMRGLGAAGATWLLLQGVKRLVMRPRPSDADPDGTRLMIARPNATSWPSSHPAVLTAFSRVAARELGVGAPGRALLSSIDIAVAASRVYVGVHYPSDVGSGLLLGRAVAHCWPGRVRRR